MVEKKQNVPIEEKIGYCNPPKHSQFKKGQSGNPKGRKKGSKDHNKLLQDELSQLIQVKEGNTTISMSKREAIIKQTVNRAVKGDLKAARMIMDMDAEMQAQIQTAFMAATVKQSDADMIKDWETRNGQRQRNTVDHDAILDDKTEDEGSKT